MERAVRAGILAPEFLECAKELCDGAIKGSDLDAFSSLEEWINWLSWSSVVLDDRDYLVAATHALRLAPELAATDYGTPKQRDLGQLWTDTIRGFLGEIAFVKWLKKAFNIHAELDYRKGKLKEFLPSDIKTIKANDWERPPNLRISIKTTKLRGIWLDIPYAQISHSDIFVLVRVGVTREHFLAFLKEISVIRDKILEMAHTHGIISEKEVDEIWDTVPEFSKIPAYIAGFLDKRSFEEELKPGKIFLANCKLRGIKNKKLVVNKFVGFWKPDDEAYKRSIKELYLKTHTDASGLEKASIEFEGIGNFSKTLHFIANSGELKKKREDWETVIKEL